MGINLSTKHGDSRLILILNSSITQRLQLFCKRKSAKYALN